MTAANVRWTGTVPACGDVPVSILAAPPAQTLTRRATPVAAVFASMTSVQIGAAVSVPLFATLGVAGTTWLRLAVAAVLLLSVARPRALSRGDLPSAAALGVVMAANAVAFSSATDRIPLGVTVAVEFCGPLSVAALRARTGGVRRLIWPVLALAGVLTLTRPWAIGGAGARTTWIGLGFAAAAGLGWAAYIVLTAHVGQRSEGLAGLSVALTVAALALAPLGLPQVRPALHDVAIGSVPLPRSLAVHALALCALAALLVPLAAYALEMVALRRLDQGVFGVWMALEPAIGGLVGALLLGQHLAVWQLPGFALVVTAGIGAQRGVRAGSAGAAVAD
ncbi:MAG TPA: EamA family transporter [Kineosporiaceae bacterium]|nr:EamA family transporter [Kineosporiaceae bacterium]